MSDTQNKVLPLQGIRVLDFTNNVAGPCSTMLMAERGAEVIHIEKPVLGDDCRYFQPLVDEQSFYYLQQNRGKKSVVLDLKDERAKEIILKMVKDSDVLVESNRPGVMKRLGLDYETLCELNPRLIYCSISAFGQEGPYAEKPGYDIIAQAFSGMIEGTGDPAGAPTKVGYPIGDYVGAINAFGSIMMALYQRTNTGIGQHIDVSLARGLMWMNGFFDHQITGQIRSRMGNHDAKLCPYGIFAGPKGSSLIIGAVNASTWQHLCEVMEREELISDPRFQTNADRVRNQEAVIEIVESWLATLEDVDAAVNMLNDAGVPNSKVHAAYELLENEHVKAVGWVQNAQVPDSVRTVSEFPCCAGLAAFSGGALQNERAANLGEHNVEVLTRYGMTREEVALYEDRWAQKVLLGRK